MRKTIYISICLIIVAGLTLASCGNRVENAKRIDCPPQIFPDYTEVTIPADIAPLNFNFADEDIDRMDVVVRGSKGGEIHSAGSFADFDSDDWQELTAKNRGGQLIVSVSIKKDGQWYTYNDFNIHVSQHDLEDWGVTYRRIAPGYEAGGNIGIYQRDLHSYKEYPILTEYSAPGHCMNCHTPNRTDPKEFTIQIRGEHPATIMQRDGKLTMLNTKTDSTHYAGSYTYWHPSGDYIAFSTNVVYQAFFVGRYKPKEVYHTVSNIVLLDTRTNELIVDERLSNEDLAIFAAFSADGKTLYYSSSKPVDVPAEYLKVKCSLCAIPFDAATGTFGNEVDTLLNGPADDHSYILARPSYDGRWLMYTRCGRSNFAVEQRDADLWMMDLKTRETRELTAINSDFSDGYHNWSSNSRWVVFASKRTNGTYGRLFFTHIDDEGNASKPFLMPQRNPRKFYDNMFDAYNVPDFTKTKVDFDVREARKLQYSDERVNVRVRE